MNYIYADTERMFVDNWNKAYGNKILHILFLINLCEKKSREPIAYQGSNIEDIFALNFCTVKRDNNKVSRYFYEEPKPNRNILFKYLNKNLIRLFKLNRYTFRTDLDKVIHEQYKAFLNKKQFLCREKLPPEDIMIKGLFYDYALMPSLNIFHKYISINNDILIFLRKKYPTMENERHVAVHYRGTDFSTHLNQIFRKGILLDKNYYANAIKKVESHLDQNVTYHLFSDEIDFLKEIFEGKKIVVHDDDANADWVSMFLMKNIIQSNSTFCWTASLYNKNISVQPEDGLNYHENTGAIPFGFHHKNSILIPKNCIND